MNPEEKAWRAAQRDKFKDSQRQSAWERLALKRGELDELLAYVDERVEAGGCDHSLRFSRRWAEGKSKPWDKLAPALGESGGYCDCEVVMNVNPDW